jgi:hypothetical protein
MADFINIANEFSKRFISAKNKKYALNQILYDINFIVYTDTKKPISYKAKAAIVKHIFEVVAGRQDLVLNEGEVLSPNFSDVVIFFERRDFIIKQLRAVVTQQEELN